MRRIIPMKKVLALILGLTMMLGIAACAKKVEVPSKSDVKKAAAEEFDMEFKVDSEDVSDDEKEAEWVLISKDGSLEVTTVPSKLQLHGTLRIPMSSSSILKSTLKQQRQSPQ